MKALEAQLAHVVGELFDRLPCLIGFSVEDLGATPEEPSIAQLERELMLANVLLDLIDDEPEARALLPGRTFARRLQ